MHGKNILRFLFPSEQPWKMLLGAKQKTWQRGRRSQWLVVVGLWKRIKNPTGTKKLCKHS